MTLTTQQKELRKTGLGGSDAAAALGISPWVSRYQLWREKTGLDKPADLSKVEAVEMGSLLEDAVATKFIRAHANLRLQRVNGTLRSVEFPWMLAHIDRAIVNPTISRKVVWNRDRGRLTTDAIFEAKTAGHFAADDWGEEGTDEIPLHYLAQTTHYLIVTGASVCFVGVLIGGQKYREYIVRRDPTLIEMVVEGEREFWRMVDERVEPDAVTAEDVKRKFSRDDGSEVEATVEVAQAVEILRQARAAADAANETSASAELAIKQFLGPHSALTVRGTIAATWKAAKGSSKFDLDAFRAAHPALAAEFTRQGAGSRRFLLKGEK